MADDKDKKAFTSEADEARDTDEIVENAVRMAIDRLTAVGAQGWIRDADGNPMAIVTGAASNKVPTVQFGNVVVGPVMVQRPVPAGTLQELIDGMRETQKAAEFVCGVESRLLQWALDPMSKVRSPVDASEAFSAPPQAYDTAQAPADPRAAIEAQEAAARAAAATAAAQPQVATAAQPQQAAAPAAPEPTVQPG